MCGMCVSWRVQSLLGAGGVRRGGEQDQIHQACGVRMGTSMRDQVRAAGQVRVATPTKCAATGIDSTKNGGAHVCVLVPGACNLSAMSTGVGWLM